MTGIEGKNAESTVIERLIKTLATIGGLGWFSAWPSTSDGASFLYTSFHIHPADVDRVHSMLERGIRSYSGSTKWDLTRHQVKRLVLCPVALRIKADVCGNLGVAAESIREEFPALEKTAARDLMILCDWLLEDHYQN